MKAATTQVKPLVYSKQQGRLSVKY